MGDEAPEGPSRMSAWRAANPEAARGERDREFARRRERRPLLTPDARAQERERAAASDASNQETTRARASNNGSGWTANDDRYLVAHADASVRDIALALGRTMWAVRTRRRDLRRRGALPPIHD